MGLHVTSYRLACRSFSAGRLQVTGLPAGALAQVGYRFLEQEAYFFRIQLVAHLRYRFGG